MKIRGLHFQVSENDHSFIYFGLFTSNRCNLNCIYCFSDAGIPRKNELSKKEKIDLIKEASKFGVKVVYIAGSGEPFLDKDIYDIIEKCYEEGLITLIYTNGLNIPFKKIEFLKTMDVSLLLKLESIDSREHDLITGVKGSLEKALRKLRILKKKFLIIKNDIANLGIASVVTGVNYKNLKILNNFIHSQNIPHFIDIMGYEGRALENIGSLNLKLTDAVKVIKEINSSESAISGCHCIFWKNGILIDHLGNARFCTEVDMGDKIGNIRDIKLEELLNKKSRLYPSRAGQNTCIIKENIYKKINFEVK